MLVLSFALTSLTLSKRDPSVAVVYGGSPTQYWQSYSVLFVLNTIIIGLMSVLRQLMAFLFVHFITRVFSPYSLDVR